MLKLIVMNCKLVKQLIMGSYMVVARSQRSIVITITHDLFHSDRYHGLHLGWFIPSGSRGTEGSTLFSFSSLENSRAQRCLLCHVDPVEHVHWGLHKSLQYISIYSSPGGGHSSSILCRKTTRYRKVLPIIGMGNGVFLPVWHCFRHSKARLVNTQTTECELLMCQVSSCQPHRCMMSTTEADPIEMSWFQSPVNCLRVYYLRKELRIRLQ